MAIPFFTGFEGCGSTGDAQSLFTTVANVAYSATGGFDNGKCLRATSVAAYLTKTVTPAKTWVTGLHIANCGLQPYSASVERSIVRFVGPNIAIYNTSGGFDIRRGSINIGTGTVTIPPALTHVEIKCYSHATLGTVEIKLDNVLVYSGANLNTGGADITSILFGSSNSATLVWDNVFIADAWQGVLRSYLVSPTSDVATGFTPSAGADNFALVDDAAQDGDTTYIESDTVGNLDLFGYGDVPGSLVVKAVSLVTVAVKTDVGVRKIKHIARQGATDYDLTEFSLGNTYPAVPGEAMCEVLSLAPDGSTWTTNIFNAISWGVEDSA